jgi:hypothetical protein
VAVGFPEISPRFPRVSTILAMARLCSNSLDHSQSLLVVSSASPGVTSQESDDEKVGTRPRAPAKRTSSYRASGPKQCKRPLDTCAKLIQGEVWSRWDHLMATFLSITINLCFPNVLLESVLERGQHLCTDRDISYQWSQFDADMTCSSGSST